MSSSLIFRFVVKVAFLPLLILSLFLYVRGHNDPGGGFIGGLVAAASFSLLAYAFGVEQMKKIMIVSPVTWIALGLAMAYGSGLIGSQFDREFLKAVWIKGEVLFLGHVGTPTLFDLGVYCVVVGMITLIVSELLLHIIASKKEERP